MPKLIVEQAGAASIQGLGRYGAQRYGLAPGGAMDRLSLAEANALTDMPAGTAAIEIGPLPARFVVADDAIRLAATGARRDILVDNRILPIGVTARLPEGSVVTVRGATSGQFSYIAIEGGVQSVDGDRKMLKDRGPNFARSWVLNRGDALYLNSATEGCPEKQLQLHQRSKAPIRVVLGPQLDYFSSASISQFLATPWSVSHAANRMAYLLEGGRIDLQNGHNIVSDGTVTGNIQIAGSGQPFVILCDRGTVGGYPKIATIISADLGRFAQLSHGERFHFAPVSVLEAQVVARAFAERLLNIKPRLSVVRHPEISIEALSSSNLAGEVVDAMAWASNGQNGDAVLTSAA